MIFDWAGRVIDFGSFAPTQIFVEAFGEFGVQVSLEEARGPMGMGKWDHIRTLCNVPEIAEHSALIPGALEVISNLKSSGVKIGSCSGYPKVVMDKVVELAAKNGYMADYVVATDEVPNGRPYPAQSLANVIALGVSDVAACVKVDDTWPGIVEGRSAGMWTVALTCSGNALGLTYDEFKKLPADKLQSERERIGAMFSDSRPHYLIDTIADLPDVLADINRRLANGEMPQSN